jgi:AcrR family transcriptional regulator
MATQPAPIIEPRIPLNRERVLRGAVSLADEGGLDSLTMRKLAQALGVEAMSLYNHVANKEDLLAGMVEIVVVEMGATSSKGSWKASIRQSSISGHDVLLRHRWACGLMMSNSRVSAERMRQMETLLGTLREAGFSPDLTHHAYHALESHIMGFTLWQVNFPFKAADLQRHGANFLRQLAVDEYPYTAEHIEQHLSPSGKGEEGEFEFGLDLILDGLERLRDTVDGLA